MEYLVVYSRITDDRSKDLNKFLQSYLETVHYLWSEEERKLEEEKSLSSSFYRHEITELESEEDDAEYQRLFPSFDSHFLDFLSSEQQIDNEEKVESIEVKPSKSPILPYSLLFQYFSSIINNDKTNLPHLINSLFNSIYEFGEDDRLISHMIRLSIKSKQTLSKYYSHLNKPFDIYHDSKPSMIVECFPTINSIEERTNYLLTTHENHPTLLEILLVIQRLKSFSIESSLIKFLYGFDILFSKLTYWQQTYASKSLQTTYDEQLNLLTSIIIKFRKYEFNCSEQSLSMIDYNQRELTIKTWWLHLFGIINSSNDLKTLEKILHEFFRKSSLGDFQTRLEICQLFSKYFHNENNLILNFLIKYYQQFQQLIQNQIHLIRKPIEQEIKKFFQIQQWKDTNYYSLKQSIEKCQKFLFKSMKKYRQLLNQPIEKYFSSYKLQIKDSLTKNEDFFRLIKLNFNKTLINYSLIGQIKTDTNSITQLSSSIFSMKIQTNDRKEIKQMYTEKRQLITQLFKKLTQIGLSFRKGLLNQTSQNSFSILPIKFQFYNIEFNQNYGLIQTKKKKLIIENRENILEKFSSFFSQNDFNYYEILYQYKQFDLFKQKNTIDPIIYQRIQGFNEHLIKIIYQQKILLNSFVQQYQNFSQTYSIYSKQNFHYSLKDFNQVDQLYYLTISLIERIYSFLLIIQSIPTNSSEQIPIIDQLPNYIQLENLNDLKILLEKFLERLNILIKKMNYYYENIIDYHPALKDISNLHQEVCLIKEQIRNVIQKLFIDENKFPNDQFIGELAKNFMQIYEQFAQIDFLKEEKGLKFYITKV